MDTRKWLPPMPLFGKPGCVYCGAPADTSDHTPPRSLLPTPFPDGIQAMTLPACSLCNAGFSQDETRTAVVVCTVSFTAADRRAAAPGGWLHSAMERDPSLHDFITTRLGSDGSFRPDQAVIATISRIMTKTAVGLLFHEFGKLVPMNEVSVVTIEHTSNVNSSAFTECHRYHSRYSAEVTPSGRELERQVLAVEGHDPTNMPPWRVYVPRYFEYMFIRRTNAKLLTSLKLHDALTALLECPWPSRAGPRRGGRPRQQRRH